MNTEENKKALNLLALLLGIADDEELSPFDKGMFLIVAQYKGAKSFIDIWQEAEVRTSLTVEEKQQSETQVLESLGRLVEAEYLLKLEEGAKITYMANIDIANLHYLGIY